MENKKLRGKDIDIRLSTVLKEMIAEGFELAPISLATVIKRLGLRSRSTLLRDGRSEIIKNAKLTQLNNAGLNDKGKMKRAGLYEQLQDCKQKLIKSEEENKLLLSKIAAIMYNLNVRGLDVEELMAPLLS